MVRIQFCGLCFRVNPDDHGEDHWRSEAAFDQFAPCIFRDFFSRFTFCFHVRLAAKQH
jgi:hypothetical protein